MLWKYYKNIVNVTLLFKKKFLPDFFFPPIFGNDIATIPFKIFSPPIFGNAIATITKKKISFFSLFRQWHCCNWFFLGALHTQAHRTGHRTQAGNLGREILVTALPKFKIFLSPTFPLSLSYFCWISKILSLSSFH